MQSYHVHHWGSYLGEDWFQAHTFDGVLSAEDVLPLMKGHVNFMDFWGKFRIHWPVEYEISVGPCASRVLWNVEELGPL